MSRTNTGRQKVEAMKYELSDIEVGDEVYFENVISVSNMDQYWTVEEKIIETRRLKVKLEGMGGPKTATIPVGCVIQKLDKVS